ncbi:MAG: hypothetical protein IKR19_08050 [Acholeplasmatales bacterium]|nr:hypothetical protein [Acholeplasmatales bacterium]
MLSVASELILEVGLKEGQKAAANFGAKAATVILAGIATTATNKALNKQRVPLTEIPEEDREKVASERRIRNLTTQAAYTAIGGLICKLAEEAIEASDVI